MGALIGTSLVAAAALWGKLKDPSPAVSQTRLEATEIVTAESRANREVLQGLLAALNTLIASTNAMKEMLARVVISQEEVVRLMREEARRSERDGDFDRFLVALDKRERAREDR